MSTTATIDEGHDHETLETMYGSLGARFEGTDPSHIVAALLEIDKIWGVHLVDDRVIISPTLGVFLFFCEVTSPEELAKLMPAVQNMLTGESRLEESEAEKIMEQAIGLASNWFEVKFPHDDSVPRSLRGATVTVKFMSDEESERHPFYAATVRAANDTVVTHRSITI